MALSKCQGYHRPVGTSAKKLKTSESKDRRRMKISTVKTDEVGEVERRVSPPLYCYHQQYRDGWRERKEHDQISLSTTHRHTHAD